MFKVPSSLRIEYMCFTRSAVRPAEVPEFKVTVLKDYWPKTFKVSSEEAVMVRVPAGASISFAPAASD
jgi:hypothetical protein